VGYWKSEACPLLGGLADLGGTGCTPSAPCAVCQGDCDSDNDCTGDLRCFQRSHGEAIPGCVDNGGQPAIYDYCYSVACPTACTACPTGYASTLGSDSCAGCIIGTYSLGADYAACLRCTPGYWQDATLSSSCVKCSPGRFGAERGIVSQECTGE
jgi:hypothetical protein